MSSDKDEGNSPEGRRRKYETKEEVRTPTEVENTKYPGDTFTAHLSPRSRPDMSFLCNSWNLLIKKKKLRDFSPGRPPLAWKRLLEVS